MLNKIKILIKDKYSNTLVLILYVLVTIFLTYPVTFRIGSAIPGSIDAFHWMRILWYTKIALLNPESTTLTHDNLLFYPDGVPTMPFMSAFNQFIYLALSPFFALHVIYTLLWLFTFIVGAFGTYSLVKYLTHNKYAAFISGIIFAFTPFHLLHGLGHLGAMTIQWIPFCALYLMKMFKEGGTRNIIYAAVFFILVAMSDLQYMVFMGIFVGLLFIYELYSIKYRKDAILVALSPFDVLKKYCLFGMVVFPGLLILTINDISIALSGNNFLKLKPYESIFHSTDFLSFFLPSILHPIFGNLVRPIYSHFLGNASEHTTFIGYTVLILSIYTFISLRKDIAVKFWLISSCIFSLLSLGPILKLYGITTFTVFNVTIPLPYLVLYYIVPFLNNSRTIGRFFVIASLTFSVLAGYGIAKILRDHQNRKNFISMIVITSIVFEFLCIPFPMSLVNQPEFYKNLSMDNEHYAILGLPSALVNYQASVETVYYQTIHGKPLVGNHLARIPQDARDFEKNTPFIRELSHFQLFKNDIIKQDITQIGSSVLSCYNVKYVIIHENYMSKNDIDFSVNLLNKALEIEPIYYKNDSIIVYKAPNSTIVPFMTLEKGWYGLETWHNNTPGRWTSDNASLMIFSPKNQNYTLSFEVGSYYIERDMSITINNELANIYKVSRIGYPNAALLKIKQDIHLNKGKNLVKFIVSQPSIAPFDVGASKDKRKLALAFQNINLIENKDGDPRY